MEHIQTGMWPVKLQTY